MSRIAAFFRWLASPIRAARTLFPFSHEGRQTLIYLVFAGAGPALTLVAIDILDTSEGAGQWGIYAAMARILGWSLLIIVCGLGMFVSIRAIKLGKDGFSADSRDPTPVQVMNEKSDPVPVESKP